MERGTVKWFEAEKGYGFITCDSGTTEYFVHQSNLDDLGSLDKGQRVEFELGEGRKGPQAVNVRLIDNVEA